MIARGKHRLSLSKEVKVSESIRIVYSRWCQINRPLYVSVKQDSLITLRVSRFPNLFINLDWFIFVCKETDIYICWYLCLLDIFNQENLYIQPLVYVVIGDQKTRSEEIYP